MYNLHGDYVETNTYFEKLNSNLDAELLGKPNHSCPVKPPSVQVWQIIVSSCMARIYKIIVMLSLYMYFWKPKVYFKI